MTMPQRPSPPRTLTRRGLVAGSAAALPLLGACAVPRVGATRADGTERDPFFAATRERRDEILRVGLVGCGGRGTGAAAQALSAEDGSVVLHAVGDVFAERTETCVANLSDAMASRHGDAGAERIDVPAERRYAGFDAYERVIDSGVDVVLLATPPGFRPLHLDRAVRANKHVFCEKPMAVDGPGLRLVMDAALRAKANRTALVSGFCWRYNYRHRAFFAELEAGRIGDVHAVYTNYLTGPIGRAQREPSWSEMEYQLRTWHYHCWLSGDHVVEQACHSLDKQAWAMGDRLPLHVDAVGGCQTRSGPDVGNIYDHFSATFDYGDGVKAFHSARQWPSSHGENRDYVWGTRGHGVIENWTPRHAITSASGDWVYAGPGNEMYQQEHDELFHSIRVDRPINDGEWMCTSTLLALMVREAAYSGKRVEPAQILESERSLAPTAFVMGDLPRAHAPRPGAYELS